MSCRQLGAASWSGKKLQKRWFQSDNCQRNLKVIDPSSKLWASRKGWDWITLTVIFVQFLRPDCFSVDQPTTPLPTAPTFAQFQWNRVCVQVFRVLPLLEVVDKLFPRPYSAPGGDSNRRPSALSGRAPLSYWRTHSNRWRWYVEVGPIYHRRRPVSIIETSTKYHWIYPPYITEYHIPLYIILHHIHYISQNAENDLS